jgi:tRNA(fMet)-specific endonuclease VapC
LTGRLLDTDTLIDLVRATPMVTQRYLAALADGTELYLSSVSFFEFEYGMQRSGRHAAQKPALERLLTTIQITAFEREDAEQAAGIRARLAISGGPIGTYDLLIAGQSLARGWTLATGNQHEFSRVEGLSLEDWRTPA